MSVIGQSQPGQLTASDLEIVTSYGAKASWPTGFTLYQRGAHADGIFVVTCGRIVLANNGRGKREFVSWVAFQGETFGCEGIAPNGRYASNACAAVPSETLHLTGDGYRALVREQPGCAIAMMGQIATERAAIMRRLHDFASASVDQRVLAALDRLSHDPSMKANGTLVLRQADYRLVCEMVGATRESISLALGRLVGSGVAERDGTAYVIHRRQLGLSLAS